ncbi:histone deacetylase family protein [Thermococcus sp.]
MEFRVIYSPLFLEHRPASYHSENPSRLLSAIKVLEKLGLWEPIEPESVSQEELLKVHSKEYVERVREASVRHSQLDPDTYVSPGTWDAALTAFGAVREAVNLSLKKRGMYLALVRPPGHHAGKSGRAFNAPTLGFCIFNNAAYGAKVAEETLDKVVAIDFDAHHGNGTQEILWNDPEAIHIDLHERDIYPWSGYEHDMGGKGAEGTKINLPMPHYSGDDDFIFAWDKVVMPVLHEVDPKVVVVSAGFDGFSGENLTTLKLTERFFRHAGSSLSHYSLAVVLEGGYSVGLEKGLPAFIEGYLREDVKDRAIRPSYEALYTVQKVVEIQREWWGL